jgi:hypothetical protein
MVRWRSVVVSGLLALWLAVPALACAPNSRMTGAEMACCKKMVGNCHMGTRQHPCCRTVAKAPQPVASLQSISQIRISFVVVAGIAIVPVASIAEAEATQVGLGLPPPAPPGLHSILRI